MRRERGVINGGGVVVDLISKTTKESYGDGPLHLDGQRMGPNC